jgi:DNA-binding MarR family transcriptional regulator
MITKKENSTDISNKLPGLVKKLSQCFTMTQISICRKYNLTVAEAALISVMDPVRKVCSTALEERQDLSKGRISRIMESLKKKGCLSKIEHHDDRRLNIIELTDRGREIRRAIIEEQAAQCRQVLAHVPEDKRAMILPALELLVAALERHKQEVSNSESD